MRDIFRNYVTHGSVQFLFAALFLCAYAIEALALWHNWPWVLADLIIAPKARRVGQPPMQRIFMRYPFEKWRAGYHQQHPWPIVP